MSLTIGALATILGYLGAEVAEPRVFERILWPQRSYNFLDFNHSLQLTLLTPMGGPLHRAALQVLDTFRDHGLFNGKQQGDMLGTAFFPCRSAVSYQRRTATTEAQRLEEKMVRNSLLIGILEKVAEAWTYDNNVAEKNTDNVENSLPPRLKRTSRPLLSLYVRPCVDHQGNAVREAGTTLTTVAGVIISEITALLVAAVCLIWRAAGGRSSEATPETWFAFFVCIPLLLKLLMIIVSVEREPLLPLPCSAPRKRFEEADNQRILAENRCSSTNCNAGHATKKGDLLGRKTINQDPGSCEDDDDRPFWEIFQLQHPALGFAVIYIESERQGPPASVFQFFRHYGHPIRTSRGHRRRELASIALVCAFMFYFPIGVCLLAWTNQETQYLWVGYQLYCVVAMHICRILGFSGCGSTENRIARDLVRQGAESGLKEDSRDVAFAELSKGVVFQWEKAAVRISVEIESVVSVQEGKDRMEQMIKRAI